MYAPPFHSQYLLRLLNVEMFFAVHLNEQYVESSLIEDISEETVQEDGIYIIDDMQQWLSPVFEEVWVSTLNESVP